jgi:hypothetical protein
MRVATKLSYSLISRKVFLYSVASQFIQKWGVIYNLSLILSLICNAYFGHSTIDIFGRRRHLKFAYTRELLRLADLYPILKSN